jgi:ankyrin repeat protein
MSTADESLYWACFSGSKKSQIIELVNQNNVNYVHPHSGDTPLHQACKQGWLDIVEMLIEKYGCDPNVVTKRNEGLLHYACQYGHINVITLLIEKYGCNPNVVTNNDESLLHYACIYGHIDVVKLLTEKYGCDPNVVTKSNESLLHYACRCGHIDVVKYLINKHHLNPIMRDNINQLEPLDYAVNNNQYYIAAYLCQHISSDEMLSQNRIKTTVNLIKYIANHPWIYNIVNPRWKTANGDNIFQLVGSSKICISHMPSALVSQILKFHNARSIVAYFKPDLRTADGITIFQLVCQSERAMSSMSSAPLMNWLSDHDSTDLMNIVALVRNTADDNNLLELICQSEKCLMQISSTVFLNQLRKSILISVTIAIPDSKTADGDTLLQLILGSEMSISRISSRMLAKLLSSSRKITMNEMKNVNPNWKTLDGAFFPHVLCLSNIENNKVTELMQYYILENGWNPDTFDSDGNTVLHTACQANKLASSEYHI